MNRRKTRLAAIMGVCGVVAACSGASTGSNSRGTEGGGCYPNGTCNAGLSCVSNSCMTANGRDGGPTPGPTPGPQDGGRLGNGGSSTDGGADAADRTPCTIINNGTSCDQNCELNCLGSGAGGGTDCSNLCCSPTMSVKAGISCGGACIDPMTDSKNCGACGSVCAGTCVNGQCKFHCKGSSTPISLVSACTSLCAKMSSSCLEPPELYCYAPSPSSCTTCACGSSAMWSGAAACTNSCDSPAYVGPCASELLALLNCYSASLNCSSGVAVVGACTSEQSAAQTCINQCAP
jgi:hypothetical protein